MNLLLLACASVFGADQEYRKGLVVCVEPRAAEVGKAILQHGGNAIDAAVATAFALAVTHPEAGNIGGGGFIVARNGQTKEVFTVDFRETAPKAATPTMFLDANGAIDKKKSGYGWFVVGVPGSPMGLWTAHQKGGKLPWKALVEPAVKLAAEGFTLDDYLVRTLNKNAKRFREYGGDGAHFAPEKPFAVGGVWKQAELANTLQLIRDQGADGFYRGETAEKIASAMKRFGGLVSKEDLADYRAVVRAPLRGTYRGCQIVAMPPPSGGGVALIEMLNILEGFPLPTMKADEPKRFHLTAEAMKVAFADRARFLGDPDFGPVPVELLTSKKHAETRRNHISQTCAMPPEIVGPDLLGYSKTAESQHTTHFSVVDGEGGMVACTTTLEDAFGSHCVAPGTGFLLNNEMHDFNLKPGLTDRKGNVGTPPNNVAPGKRMLSSMTPTLVFKDGKPFLVLGSPGGRTIINTVLMTLTNVIDHHMDVQAAVDFGRIHHQWLPADLKIESRLPASLDADLKAMGHYVAERKPNAPYKQGDCHAILIDPQSGALRPGVDHRLRGAAAGF